ncbi:unnamed protein product [Tenebrio molitor]|nr:unnamed protein product [Tenebrio molitor]
MKFLKYSVATNTFTHLLLILSQCSEYIEINGNISLSKVTFLIKNMEKIILENILSVTIKI